MSHKFHKRELLTVALSLIVRHFGISSLFILVSLVLATLWHFLVPSYQAYAVLYLRSADTSPILNATSKITGYSRREYGQEPLNVTYLKILKSDEFRVYIVESLLTESAQFDSMSDELKKEMDMETNSSRSARLEFGKNLVDSVLLRTKDDDLIEVHAISRRPKVAVELANLMAKFATRFLVHYELQEISAVERFMLSEANAAQQRVDSLGRDLESARSQVSDSLYHYGGSSRTTLARLSEEYELARVKVEENEVLINEMKKQIEKSGISISGLRSLANGDEDGNQVESANQAGAPAVDETFVSGKFRGRLFDRYSVLLEERPALISKLEAIKDRLKIVSKQYRPEYEQKVGELSKKLETEFDLYAEIRRQLSAMNVYRISVENRVRSYSDAAPDSSRRALGLSRRLLITFCFALGLVCIFFFALEHFNPVVTSKSDLQSMGIVPVGSIPVVGQSPNLHTRVIQLFKGGAAEVHSRQSERLAFQFLRNRLVNILKAHQSKGQILSVISPGANEGKSFLAANLAILFGRMNYRVLVVDFDVMKSTTSQFFSADSPKGIVELLEGSASLDEVLIESASSNVSFLPTGMNPREFESLAAPRVKAVLETLRSEFDIILLDTPAYLARPESLMIANEADHILLVTNYNTTRAVHLRELLEGLNPDKLTRLYGVINRHEEILRSSVPSYYIQSHGNSNNGSTSSLAS